MAQFGLEAMAMERIRSGVVACRRLRAYDRT